MTDGGDVARFELDDRTRRKRVTHAPCGLPACEMLNGMGLFDSRPRCGAFPFTAIDLMVSVYGQTADAGSGRQVWK